MVPDAGGVAVTTYPTRGAGRASLAQRAYRALTDGSTPVVIVTAVALWLIVSPMFGATFGVIDDHFIARLLGPDHVITVPELLPSIVTRIEADTQRFRPLRYVGAALEALVWGWNPVGWYVDRLVFAIVTVAATAVLAARYVARPIAVLAGLLAIVGLQAESWYRLGPQEAYGMPLLMVGLAAIAHGRSRPGLVLVVLAALTKEAFVPVAALAVVWAWWLGQRRGAVIAGVAVAAIGVAIVILLTTHGEPFGQARTASEIVAELRWMGSETAVTTLWPAGVLVLAVLDRRLAVIALAVAAAIVLPQAVLDSGMRAGRYLLPAALGAVLLVVLALAAIDRRYPRASLVAAYAIAGVALIAAVGQGALARASAADTQAFQTGIAELTRTLEARPDATLVVRPAYVNDFEPVISVRAYVPGGTAMLLPPPSTGAGFGGQLSRTMDIASRDGGLGYAPWREPGSCVEADFHERAPAPLCDVVVVLTGWDLRH